MKKILIVNNNLHIGGVQKALLSLLRNIGEKYEVTLLLFCPVGECMEELPPSVKLIKANSAYRYLGMNSRDAKSIKDKLGRSFYAALTRLFSRKYAVKLMSLGQKKLEGFDLAISYLHDGSEKAFYGGCNDFVLKHVEAKKKVAFLHCDYLLCGANTQKNREKYTRFDQIAACSQGCAQAFLQANPQLKEKVCVVENCHSFDRLQQAAAEDAVELKKEKINIVTVARLGKEKSVERAVLALSQLGSLKEKIHYWIVGDGVQMPLIRQLLQEHKLASCVSLLGEKRNPYGYMAKADLLLIPSVSEAAPLVIGEAAFLKTPILSTKTSSAKEMILDKELGWVCENSVEGLAQALKDLLQAPEKLKEVQENLQKRTFDNRLAVEQFEKLI